MLLYRGGGRSPIRKLTPLQVVQYEREELGNDIKVMRPDLLSCPATMEWLSTTADYAAFFGPVEVVPLDNPVIVARDPYDGVLVIV